MARSKDAKTPSADKTANVKDAELKPAFKGAGTDASGKASWFSYATHHWTSPLVHYGYRHLLRPADIYTLPDEIDPEVSEREKRERERERG
jgi:hypothetical protein